MHNRAELSHIVHIVSRDTTNISLLLLKTKCKAQLVMFNVEIAKFHSSYLLIVIKIIYEHSGY